MYSYVHLEQITFLVVNKITEINLVIFKVTIQVHTSFFCLSSEKITSFLELKVYKIFLSLGKLSGKCMINVSSGQKARETEHTTRMMKM